MNTLSYTSHDTHAHTQHLKKFSSSSLFRRPDEVIYHDRSPIVQLVRLVAESNFISSKPVAAMDQLGTRLGLGG